MPKKMYEADDIYTCKNICDGEKNSSYKSEK